MAHADFIHLRTHSAYSLSAGAIKLKDLPKLCVKQGMPAVAVTDTGNLFGALEFSVTAAAEGVQPIIGCELGLRPPRAEVGVARAPGGSEPERIVLLCQSETGYRNLTRLVSRSYLETAAGEGPQLDIADLEAASEGLLCLTGGVAGPLGSRLMAGQADEADAVLARLRGYFPGRLYVEIQRHGIAQENRIEAAMVDLAYRHDLPLVATNDVYFADAGFYEAHDALLCIADGTTVAAGDRRRLTPEHHFKSAEAMRLLFADLPEACDNTVTIARRCAFILRKVKPILPPFPTESGASEVDEVRRMAHEGLTLRLERQVFPRLSPDEGRDEVERRYRTRLDYELDTIAKMGFAGYFLIVADFIQWAKRQGIPVGPGRGSGAGSVCAWSLAITDLDPLPLNLLFERFLNPERVSMPDFDIDFCQERRGEVLQYVQQKYGHDRVAQIITFGKLQARAVLRDVGRVLGMPYGQVDRICKLVPNNPANPVTLREALEADAQLRAMRDGDEAVARLIEMAMKLEGLYRHASTHAAGVVIADRALDELVPLYRDPRSDMPVTQFNMKWVEDAGLIKFDFLGLKTLTVIDHAVRLAKARDPSLDLLTIPFDDGKTFEMLARGETVGVFQLEGTGMRDMLRKLRPDRFEDIIAVVALYRPGPMENIPHYIAIKHGQQAPDYLYPSLEPILRETHGIMIYQEQVMQIAQVLSGFSLGGADLLRRAMGKKIKAEMDGQRKLFVEGAAARGVPAETAEHIFDLVAKFAGYGFNKSHAAAYALVSYQTAFLKANYPLEFLAASMTLDLGNTDKLNVFRQELQRMGIPLLPPDINRSLVGFAVEEHGGGGAVRYGLAAIKGVGLAAMEHVVAERQQRGPFRDAPDLARRLDAGQLNRKQFESLAKAGAFDSVCANRAAIFAAGETILRHAAAAANERGSSQLGMFGELAGAGSALALPKVADWTRSERLQNEFEAIGFYLAAHPLDRYGGVLRRLQVLPANRLTPASMHDVRGRVRLAGIVLGRKERTSARGNRFAFVQMSDLTGSFEITVFAELLAEARSLLDSGQPLLVSADARLDGEETVRLTAQSIEALDEIAASHSTGLFIRVTDGSALAGLREILGTSRHGGPRAQEVRVLVPIEAGEVEIALGGRYALGAAARSALQAIAGVADLRDF